MRTAAIALALLAASPALAATGASKLAGSWTMAGAKEGDAACTLKLKSTQAIGGWGVEVPKACVKAFPRLEDAAAWTLYPDGAIGLINPLRARIYRFAKTGDGDYVTAPNKDGKQFILSKGKPGKELTAQQRMSGGWSLTSTGGEPKCAFASKADAKGLSGTLTMKPGCDAIWKNRGWAKWSIAKKTLTISDAKGKALQTFRQGDIVSYEGTTARGNPIYFSRD